MDVLDFSSDHFEVKLSGGKHKVKHANRVQLKEFSKRMKEAEGDEDKINEVIDSILIEQGLPEKVLPSLTVKQVNALVKAITSPN